MTGNNRQTTFDFLIVLIYNQICAPGGVGKFRIAVQHLLGEDGDGVACAFLSSSRVAGDAGRQ
jgi:hypothetical protein